MTIGIWGDSITFGSCDSEAIGWSGRLRKTLPVNDDNQLYSFGVCGETTEDLLKRFSTEAQAIEPEKVIFAIGINDSKLPDDSSQNCVNIDVFKKNLKQLISEAFIYTSDITFVGLTTVNSEWRSTKGSRFLNEEIIKYDTAIKRIAGENGFLYISMTHVLDPINDLADGLHPNTDGYQKMFKVVQQKITF